MTEQERKTVVPVDINTMFTETFNRHLDVKYAERVDGEYRFLVVSRKEGQGNANKFNTWLTEEELDQFLLNLIEAKMKFGRSQH